MVEAYCCLTISLLVISYYLLLYVPTWYVRLSRGALLLLALLGIYECSVLHRVKKIAITPRRYTT